MGMFDKPQYLTGDNGYVQPGETFYIHNARIDGKVTVGGTEREQVKLLCSYTTDGEQTIVFTSGAGIVGQVKRMSKDDLEAMRHGGMHVRLDEVPSSKGNDTRILTPSDQPPPTGSSMGGDDPTDF